MPTTTTLSRPRSDPLSADLHTAGFTPVTKPPIAWLNEGDPRQHATTAPQASRPVERKDNTAVALLLAVVILLVGYVAASQLVQSASSDNGSVTNSDTSKQDVTDNTTPPKPVIKQGAAPVLVPTASGTSVYCPAPGSPIAKYVRGTAWMPPECWLLLGLPVPNYQR